EDEAERQGREAARHPLHERGDPREEDEGVEDVDTLGPEEVRQVRLLDHVAHEETEQELLEGQRAEVAGGPEEAEERALVLRLALVRVRRLGLGVARHAQAGASRKRRAQSSNVSTSQRCSPWSASPATCELTQAATPRGSKTPRSLRPRL